MKITIFGSGIYNALIGMPPGGAELQTSLFAKAFKNYGFDVTIIDNFKSGKSTNIEGIKIIFSASINIKILRYFFQRIPRIIYYSLFKNTHYFFVRSVNQIFLIPLLISKIKRIHFIYSISSNIDCESFIKRLIYSYKVKVSLINWIKNDLPSSITNYFLLKFADSVLVQSNYQFEKLKKRDIKAIIFRNIIPFNSDNRKVIKKDYYVYIGSIARRKGIAELLKLIKEIPEKQFIIIGAPQGEFGKNAVEIFNRTSNIKYLGALNREKVIEYLLYSKALINLSKVEGFPNTFLEAWSTFTPVISLYVNPDNVITDYNLGIYGNGNINSIIKYIKLNNINSIDNDNVLKYLKKYHNYDNAIERLMSKIHNN